jgi:hypothetical protein
MARRNLIPDESTDDRAKPPRALGRRLPEILTTV